MKKLTCDCGHALKKGEVKVHGLLTSAMICPHCKFNTTKPHSKEFRKRLADFGFGSSPDLKPFNKEEDGFRSKYE